MFGYKVVGVTEGKQHSSVLYEYNKYITEYIPNKFVKSEYPLWYFSTLKEAIKFINDCYTSYRYIQIWKCEVIKSQKMVRHTFFSPKEIESFWRIMKNVKKIADTPHTFITRHGFVRVAEQIKLTKLILDLPDVYKYRNELNNG